MRNKKAFTLIEVLVVIAITVGLVAMIFPNFTNMRELARDNQRKSDIKQLQKMLEIYKEASSPLSYPDSPGGANDIPEPCNTWSAGSALITNKVPGDPSGNCTSTKRYYYKRVVGDSLRYEMYACLENKNDKDGTVNGPLDFPSITGWNCTSNYYYKVVEP